MATKVMSHLCSLKPWRNSEASLWHIRKQKKIFYSVTNNKKKKKKKKSNSKWLLPDRGWSDFQRTLTHVLSSEEKTWWTTLGQKLSYWEICKNFPVYPVLQARSHFTVAIPQKTFSSLVLRRKRRCHHHWNFNWHPGKFRFTNPETRVPELWFFL